MRGQPRVHIRRSQHFEWTLEAADELVLPLVGTDVPDRYPLGLQLLEPRADPRHIQCSRSERLQEHGSDQCGRSNTGKCDLSCKQ